MHACYGAKRKLVRFQVGELVGRSIVERRKRAPFMISNQCGVVMRFDHSFAQVGVSVGCRFSNTVI